MKRKVLAEIPFYGLILAGMLILLSPRVKSWAIMGLIALGFFRPQIPPLGPPLSPKRAPRMLLRDAAGRSVDIRQWKGKVVFINFWATWCSPCLAEIPSINRLYQKMKNKPGIVFVMADVDAQPAKSSAFLAQQGIVLPVYSVSGAEKLYDQGIPTTVVLGKQGNIVFSHFNRANYDTDDFQQYLERLSAQ